MATMAQVANNAANAAAQRIGAALSDAQYFESNMVALEQIRRQLDSSSTKDKLDAMKRVIALISLGKDASTFFPEVVKNVAASSLEVKKLVYLYLVHYAEFKQDLALLAINSFQKDLSDPNEHIRALSLRVLSSIRVKIILQVVIHAIGKAAKDASAYVRKAAAYAICKVCELDAGQRDVLAEPLAGLIADRSTQVIGAAVVAFDQVSPDSFDIVHPHYRRICRILKDTDPWGQIAVMQMLMRYARVNFTDPYPASDDAAADIRRPANKPAAEAKETEDFYADVPKGGSTARNADLSLFILSVQPLFYSLNSSVVASAVAVYFHLATPSEFATHAVKPLMRLVGLDDDGGQIVGLRLASAVAVRYPAVLLPYVDEFYVSAAHSAPVRDLRLHVLNTFCLVAGDKRGLASKSVVLKEVLIELQDYLFRADKALAAGAARCFGSLATAHPKSTVIVVRLLSSVVSNTKDPVVLTEAIGVLRGLLQRNPETQSKALPLLIAMLLNEDPADETIGMVKEPAARASIVWLIGEFHKKLPKNVALEALRILTKGFVKEDAAVKLQILSLSAKLLASKLAKTDDQLVADDSADSQKTGAEMRRKFLEYLCEMAKYDQSYDVREKSRLLNCLFLTDTVPGLTRSAIRALTTKPPRKVDEAQDNVRDLAPGLLLGSMSHVLGSRPLPGSLRLRPWAEADSEDAVRDEAEGNAVLDREYTSVSSASFGHIPSASSQQSKSQLTMAGISNMVWNRGNTQPPPDVFQRDSHGNIIGFGQPADSAHAAQLATSRPSYAGINVNNIDTEAFYGEESEEGSTEYETDSEYEYVTESEEEEDVPQRNGAGPSRAGGPSGATVLTDDLLDLIGSPAPQPKVGAGKKKLTGLEDILAGIEPPPKQPESSPTPAHVDAPLIGDALPVKLKELAPPRVVSVEASLLANLDMLNLDPPKTENKSNVTPIAATKVEAAPENH